MFPLIRFVGMGARFRGLFLSSAARSLVLRAYVKSHVCSHRPAFHGRAASHTSSFILAGLYGVSRQPSENVPSVFPASQ